MLKPTIRSGNQPQIFLTNVELAGSARKIPSGKKVSTINLDNIIEVTVKVRRKNAIEDYVKNLNNGNKILSHAEFEDQFGANLTDLKLVEEYAHRYDLTTVLASVARRSVILKGTVHNFSMAFGVYLSNYQSDNGQLFRGRTGTINIPAELQGIVEGVFGLDNREQAFPRLRIAKKDGHLLDPRAASSSYYASEVAKAYGYPSDVTGKGQCIALIELGGGYRAGDMNTYFSTIGQPVPVIRSQSVDGANNNPSTADSADGEVVLDIQVAGTIASGASIVVYFAPNTDQGFLDAISTALHDTVNNPSVISISWGAAESGWSAQALTNFNQTFMSAAVLGVTIMAAAGDHGSADGETDGKAHVDFPASSPYVLACGGTKLTQTSETVWNENDGWATGGGISEVFPVPVYQGNITLPDSVSAGSIKGRGLPDIAANADSTTGYKIYLDGQWGVVGGTSAVAPLMAGLIVLSNEKLNRSVGYLHPKLYTADKQLLKDITSGNNTTADAGGYSAGVGWDACTGLGAPLGTIINAL